MPKKTTNKMVRGSKESLIQSFFINLSLELFVFCLIDNHSLHPLNVLIVFAEALAS